MQTYHLQWIGHQVFNHLVIQQLHACILSWSVSRWKKFPIFASEEQACLISTKTSNYVILLLSNSRKKEYRGEKKKSSSGYIFFSILPLLIQQNCSCMNCDTCPISLKTFEAAAHHHQLLWAWGCWRPEPRLRILIPFLCFFRMLFLDLNHAEDSDR